MSSAGRPFRTWKRTSSGRLSNVRTLGLFLILRLEGTEKHLEHLQWITGIRPHIGANENRESRSVRIGTILQHNLWIQDIAAEQI